MGNYLRLVYKKVVYLGLTNRPICKILLFNYYLSLYSPLH